MHAVNVVGLESHYTVQAVHIIVYSGGQYRLECSLAVHAFVGVSNVQEKVFLVMFLKINFIKALKFKVTFKDKLTY